MALEATGGRVRRSEAERLQVEDLLKQGKTIKEIMEEMYGGYKSGCADYNFISNTRNDLKKAGFLGITPAKISSKKAPKKDTRGIALSAEQDAELQEIIADIDDSIAKCKKRLAKLERYKEVLINLR